MGVELISYPRVIGRDTEPMAIEREAFGQALKIDEALKVSDHV